MVKSVVKGLRGLPKAPHLAMPINSIRRAKRSCNYSIERLALRKQTRAGDGTKAFASTARGRRSDYRARSRGHRHSNRKGEGDISHPAGLDVRLHHRDGTLESQPPQAALMRRGLLFGLTAKDGFLTPSGVSLHAGIAWDAALTPAEHSA
jgi:hypothetical protein